MSTVVSTTKKPARTWRVLDIVAAAVISIVCGIVIWVWNSLGYAWYTVMDALTPGLGGIATGGWLLGGPLGMLIIRKPGAAILCEVLAACLEAAVGSQWGITVFFSGFAQGLGTELVFLALGYRLFNLPVAMISGAMAGVAATGLELFMSMNYLKGVTYNLIYLVCNSISGAIIAGLVAWLLVRALATTGALDRFGAGRQRQQLV